MPDPLAERWELAVSAAREAGRHTLQYFRQPHVGYERKGDDSPVTIADREAEQLLRRLIAARFPRDAILGEEFGETPGDSGCRWILDPIDGTKSFISGVPLYSTLVGVEHQGEPRIGVIVVPALDECVHALRGRGAWYIEHNNPPRRTQVSPRRTLGESTFVTSQVNSFAKRNAAAAYARLEEACYVTRTWGDGYGYLLVATGRAEVMVDPIMNVWDAAAMLPVIVEAGGAFTNWAGEPTIHGGEGVAANPHVLPEVLAILRPFAKPA